MDRDHRQQSFNRHRVWWIPYYPVWSLVYILIGLFVGYGFVVQGGRNPDSV